MCILYNRERDGGMSAMLECWKKCFGNVDPQIIMN